MTDGDDFFAIQQAEFGQLGFTANYVPYLDYYAGPADRSPDPLVGR
jgi:hypothetical protein